MGFGCLYTVIPSAVASAARLHMLLLRNGPATRNRTWISSLEGCCTIHCAMASCVVGPP